MLWHRVDGLIDSAPSLADLRAHGLQLLAARRWRAAGRTLPAGLVREELRAEFATHAAPRVLARVRAVCDGPIIVMKGPAVAARFPDPATRPFEDLDLLVPDAQRTRAQLLGAGFRPAGDPAFYPPGLHHLRPVTSPDLPLQIELHIRPKWVDGFRPPSFAALLEGAEANAVGVDGMLALAPARHAVVLAAHLWAHDVVSRVLRLLDVAVMVEASERREAAALARRWGMSRLWEATLAVADALFVDERSSSWALRTWARPLRAVREPTVWELHLSRLVAPFLIHPPAGVPSALAGALGGLLLPQPGESWRRKLERTSEQIARPSMRRTEHVRRVEEGVMGKAHYPEDDALPEAGIDSRRSAKAINQGGKGPG